MSLIKEGERLDMLTDKVGVIQSPEHYCFGTDAVRLAQFAAKSYRRYKNACELGGGSGVISLMLAAENKVQKMLCVEIESFYAQMCSRSVLYNNMQNTITVKNMPAQDLTADSNNSGAFDMVITNPPYFKPETNSSIIKNAVQRQELSLSVEDVAKISGYLLSDGGALFLCHRVERMAQIFSLMRENALEPKICHFLSIKRPKVFLLKCVKRAKTGIKFLFGGE